LLELQGLHALLKERESDLKIITEDCRSRLSQLVESSRSSEFDKKPAFSSRLGMALIAGESPSLKATYKQLTTASMVAASILSMKYDFTTLKQYVFNAQDVSEGFSSAIGQCPP